VVEHLPEVPGSIPSAISFFCSFFWCLNFECLLVFKPYDDDEDNQKKRSKRKKRDWQSLVRNPVNAGDNPLRSSRKSTSLVREGGSKGEGKYLIRTYVEFSRAETNKAFKSSFFIRPMWISLIIHSCEPLEPLISCGLIFGSHSFVV